jgi:hypothetical protein
MLEDLIPLKLEKCCESAKADYPEWFSKGKFDEYHQHSLIDKNFPLQIREIFFWKELEIERYWGGIHYLKKLTDEKNDYFSAEDLKDITQVVLGQIKKGKIVAAGHALHSHVFSELEGSVLEKFVTEEDKRYAINAGFWESLEFTASEKKSPNDDELATILYNKAFFKYYDFEAGVERAAKIADSINLERFSGFNLYMKWYLVQETAIRSTFDGSKADEVCAKLVAPVVRQLYLESSSNYDESAALKSLARFFVRGNMIKTAAMQRTLGEMFELELQNGITGYSDSFDADILENCSRMILDSEARASKIWELNKKDMDLAEICNGVEKYIPKEAYQKYIDRVKEELLKEDKFNSSAFSKWMEEKIASRVSKSIHSQVRNKVLEKYYSQKPRPKAESVLALKYYVTQISDEDMREKLAGFIFSDLLNKGKFSEANEFLFRHDKETTYTARERKMQTFYAGIVDYVKTHGPIKLDPKGLEAKTCYPKYNAIADMYTNSAESEVKLFSLKE